MWCWVKMNEGPMSLVPHLLPARVRSNQHALSDYNHSTNLKVYNRAGTSNGEGYILFFFFIRGIAHLELIIYSLTSHKPGCSLWSNISPNCLSGKCRFVHWPPQRNTTFEWAIPKFTIDAHIRPAEGSTSIDTCIERGFWKLLLCSYLAFYLTFYLLLRKHWLVCSLLSLSWLVPFNGGAGSFLLWWRDESRVWGCNQSVNTYVIIIWTTFIPTWLVGSRIHIHKWTNTVCDSLYWESYGPPGVTYLRFWLGELGEAVARCHI